MSSEATKGVKKPFYKSLHFQVLFALIAGIILGHFYPKFGEDMKPFGDAYIKLIKMIIAPIIFCTVVSGIAGMGDMKKVGRVGAKALLYFEIVSTLALFLGVMAAMVFQPGAGMNIDLSSLDTKSIAAYTGASAPKMQGTVDFLMNIIPATFIDAFAKGNMLQVLCVAILFGSALSRMGAKGAAVLGIVNDLSKPLFGIVDIIMKLAPIGVFGAIAFTIGKFGVASLGPLVKLIALYHAVCILFILVVLGALARWAGFSMLKFLSYLKEEILIVLGTSASESVLPRVMEKMEKLGCAKSVVGLVVPTGYSFNLDGTSMYLTVATLFLAQATNTDLSLAQQVTIFAVMMLTSKGAAGITGSAFITLVATLSTIDSIPVAAVAIIFGVDRLLMQIRAVTNMVGNATATVIMAKWENELDTGALEQGLTNGPDFEWTDTHKA